MCADESSPDHSLVEVSFLVSAEDWAALEAAAESQGETPEDVLHEAVLVKLESMRWAGSEPTSEPPVEDEDAASA